MNKGVGVLIFTIGAAVGSAATWYFAKKKYERIAKEEIESVKKAFRHKTRKQTDSTNDISEQQEKAEMAKEKPNISEYAKQLSRSGYTDYSKTDIFVDEEDQDDGDPGPDPEPMFGDPSAKPRVISKEEFGENDDYDKQEFTYFSDHIVGDDDDRILEDVENVIGFESLAEFAKDPDTDVVYVRNDRLKTYYEVVRDERTYSQLLQSKPYLREV